MRPFLALIARDLRLAARIGGSGGLGLVFFLMIVTLIPFALGPDLNLLDEAAGQELGDDFVGRAAFQGWGQDHEAILALRCG